MGLPPGARLNTRPSSSCAVLLSGLVRFSRVTVKELAEKSNVAFPDTLFAPDVVNTIGDALAVPADPITTATAAVIANVFNLTLHL